ncbi:MAG TPA: 50S ribosomal protein L11 methyltransferase, partial [Candidatus Saccharimonadales bacterium]|nr:50S ribosomal protein L11 methyltransferase [Candidatus Saccharimonadales bacterium]
MIINIIVLLIILFLLVILSWVWPPNSPWAPWWRTNKKTARAICKLAGISNKDVVYDLGCGDGTAIITASKEHGAKAVGIEIDPTRVLIAKMRILLGGLQGKITVKRKNFFDEDISMASVIFVYLVPRTLNKLLPKFKKELKKGTRIVSYRYEMNLPLKKYDKE